MKDPKTELRLIFNTHIDVVPPWFPSGRRRDPVLAAKHKLGRDNMNDEVPVLKLFFNSKFIF